MKKSLLAVFILMFTCLVASCASSISIDDYKSNLAKTFEDVEVISQATVKELVSDFLSDMPDLALPVHIIVAGNFSNEIEIDAWMKGEKEFPVEVFANEVRGAIIEFESSIIAGIAMGYKEQIIAEIINQGVNIPEEVQVLQKGQYVFIGYPDFIKESYQYNPAPAPVPTPTPSNK